MNILLFTKTIFKTNNIAKKRFPKSFIINYLIIQFENKVSLDVRNTPVLFYKQENLDYLKKIPIWRQYQIVVDLDCFLTDFW